MDRACPTHYVLFPWTTYSVLFPCTSYLVLFPLKAYLVLFLRTTYLVIFLWIPYLVLFPRKNQLVYIHWYITTLYFHENLLGPISMHNQSIVLTWYFRILTQTKQWHIGRGCSENKNATLRAWQGVKNVFCLMWHESIHFPWFVYNFPWDLNYHWAVPCYT